jgi:hypothetical protein
MASDIQAAISGSPIKNGTAVVSTTFTGEYSSLDSYVKNTPTITDIQNKYDNRLDDVVYYSIATRGTPVSGCC